MFRSVFRSLPSLLVCLATFGSLELPLANAQDTVAGYQSAMASAVRNAAERVLPSVVAIEVIGVAQSSSGETPASDVAQDAPTCGVIVDRRGYIVASDLIVRRPSASILVVLSDSTRLAAKVVARDHHRGLVLLRVSSKTELPAIELPNSIELPIGSTVVGVGRYGSDNAPIVTSGILSAVGRLEGTMLQSDARVSPAFYGGPLIDLYGNAIGIQVPAIAKGGAPDDTSWYDSGIAFAVPLDVVASKLERLINGEDIKKGLIGIVPKSNDALADGTELAAVRSRSPAERAGMKPGDSILSVAGTPVEMFQQIKEALGPLDAGETIEIELQRGEERKKVSVKLADSIPPLQPQRLGIWADEQTSGEGDGQRTEVVVRGVIPGTSADQILEKGDTIEKIGEADIPDLATLRRIMITAVPDEEVTVVVTRNEMQKQVRLTPTSVSGPSLEETLPDWEDKRPVENWKVEKLRLPDVSNVAAYVGPPTAKEDDAESATALGMIALLLPPENRDPEKILDSYRDIAGRFGVVVCAISCEDEKRWEPKEIDVVSRLVTLLSQRVNVSSSAVAIAAPGVIKGVPASAADSMVIAIALSDRKNFSGIAVSKDAKPPAVRLRENEPDRSLEILLPIESVEDGPTWLAPLSRAGYPFSLGGDVELSDLMRWTRLLQTL